MSSASAAHRPSDAGAFLSGKSSNRGVRFIARRVRRIRWKVQSFFGKHSCNVCDHKVFEFLPLAAVHPGTVEDMARHGFNHRLETFNVERYSCPFCGSTDRDRLYALYLEGLFAKSQGKRLRIVDFAPVRSISAFIRKRMPADGEYRTADLFDPNVDDKVDLMDMHIYPDARFDFFICSHVLEHVPDDRRALRELYRITKPGGSGIVMVPIPKDIEEIDEDPSITNEAERCRRFGQSDHVRLYSRKALVNRAREAGFEVAQLNAETCFGAATLDQIAVLKDSILYVVTRPK